MLSLGKGETISVFLKFNSKELRCGSEIFETEVVFERGYEGVDLRERWNNEENVININEKIERTRGSIIERRIGLGTMKVEFKKLPSEFAIPLSRSLFETV